MEALHDIVKAGKARYIGATTMFAWQFLKAQHVAERNGWTKFVAMQNHYNLMYREEEREILPLCKEDKVGVMPWSPLAAGRLARPWGETDERAKVDVIGKAIYSTTADSDRKVVERVAEIAEKRGVPMPQIALAWLLQREPVTAPIVGTTEISHIEDAVAALSIHLTSEEMAFLEEPYVPHPVLGMTF
jgi:aryl-alcohol dehydrogenase-like predicted oxidoreductase